jgi:hypothetical protein
MALRLAVACLVATALAGSSRAAPSTPPADAVFETVAKSDSARVDPPWIAAVAANWNDTLRFSEYLSPDDQEKLERINYARYDLVAVVCFSPSMPARVDILDVAREHMSVVVPVRVSRGPFQLLSGGYHVVRVKKGLLGPARHVLVEPEPPQRGRFGVCKAP